VAPNEELAAPVSSFALNTVLTGQILTFSTHPNICFSSANSRPGVPTIRAVNNAKIAEYFILLE
jgi:hypothetical protein